MRTSLIGTGFLILLSIAPVTSAIETDAYKLCQRAKDFWGCVRSMNGTDPQLRKYGPLQVDWSIWKPVNGSYIAQTFNSSGKGFYLAVNCLKAKINVTDRKGVWKGWNSPVKGFEYDLLEDICKEVGTPIDLKRE